MQRSWQLLVAQCCTGEMDISLPLSLSLSVSISISLSLPHPTFSVCIHTHTRTVDLGFTLRSAVHGLNLFAIMLCLKN